MNPSLRILHLEDDPKDAEIVQGVLETGGIVCEVTRVDTEDDFVASLERGGFELILADFSLPSFDGLSALKIARERRPDVPFIFVSGTLGEEVAIDALKIGATDYVVKGRLSRIVSSVHRALREAREHAERERAEQQLRRSEAFLAEGQRISHTGSWAWIISTGKVTWSDEQYRMLGFEPGTQEPSVDLFLSVVHPEDRARIRQVLEEAMRTRTSYEIDYRVVLRDGAVRHMRSVARPVPGAAGEIDEYIGVTTDVTERVAREEELRRSQHYLAEAQRLSHIGSWAFNAAGFGYWSPELFKIHGLDPGGKAPSIPEYLALVHPEDRDFVVQEIEKMLAGAEGFDFKKRIVRPDGAIRHVRCTGIRATTGGIVQEFVGTGMDVTEQERAEEELRRLERQLRQAQRFEAMGTLAGGIAHDFNNILGAILGYGERALRDAGKGSRLRHDLDSIMAAGERGRALVDRILAFSRGRTSERVAVHVEQVVREAVDLLEAKLPDRIRVEAMLDAGRAAVLGDPTQVHQVVMNLGTNAVQAMPAGGTLFVLLDVARFDAERAATIGTVGAGEWVVLKVVDSGGGIGPDIVERIFDPFFTTKEPGVGTGLGLSLVLRIVTEAGGAIDVASTPGVGSTFTVYLPRAGDAADTRADTEPAMARGDGQRVLVVDDEEPLLQLAARTLEELGYAPVAFTSSAAALDAFRADPRGFDAVITDERMPGITGVELIRQIRDLRHTIPILLVSGYVGGAVTSRAYSEGADEVLKKPLSAQDLAANLARVLRQ